MDRFNNTAGPVATNLRRCAEQACSLTDDKYFQSVARDGFRIQWERPPVPPPTAPAFRSMTPEQEAEFGKEHDRLLQEEAVRWVRRATEPPAPGDQDEHLQPIFCIQQKGRWRQIWNMRWSNQHMRPLTFKMTGVAAWKALIKKNDWMCSVDLKDAYLNILMAEGEAKYQRYVFRGQVWEIITLPFGNAQAPWAFTRFIAPLLSKWRAKFQIRCLAWLDDLIFAAQSPAHLNRAMQSILDDLSWAGLKVNTKPGKSTLVPTQTLTWCGIEWSTRTETLHIPRERVKNVKDEIRHVLKRHSRGQHPTARVMASVLGKLQALAEAVLPQRVHCRTLLVDLNKAIRKCDSWNCLVFLAPTSLEALTWLRKNISRWNGASWATPSAPALSLTTDASPYAWGAILTLPDGQTTETSGYFSEREGSRWQNEREALAVQHALSTHSRLLLHLAHNSHGLLQVMIEQDNASVVSYIRKQGGGKRALSLIIERMLVWCWDNNIQLLARWIAGSEMPADVWSRELAKVDTGDWAVHPSTFRWLCGRLNFAPTIDLMASRLNHKVPRFFSFRPDPSALDFDALSRDKNWATERGYVAPPVNMVTRVLGKAKADRATILLVVPHWPSSMWWPALAPPPLGNRVSELLTFPVTTQGPHQTMVQGRGRNPATWPGQQAAAAVLSFV